MPTIKNNVLLIGIAITSILSIFCGYKYFDAVSENEKKSESFNAEKQILQTQLQEILVSYDKVKAENVELKKNQAEFFENYSSLASTASPELEYTTDKSPAGKVHNLRIQNENFRNQISELETKIERNKIKIHQIEEHNFSVEEKTVVKQLKAVNVNARGVRVLTDLYKKNKVQPIQELRVCFTLEGSEFVGVGNKKVYIQIINPNNQIVSLEKDFFEDSQGNKVIYSSKTDVAYNQKDTDVCTYVDLEKNKTIKGTYKVNLFYNSIKIGSTSYDYN